MHTTISSGGLWQDFWKPILHNLAQSGTMEIELFGIDWQIGIVNLDLGISF